MKINKLRLKDKKLYLIIRYESFKKADDFLNKVANELENGFEIIELDCTNSNLRELIPNAKKLRELCSIYNALYIVKDRIDVAQITEADGVFLEENSIDITSVKQLLNENAIIGTSYFSEESDYIGTVDKNLMNINSSGLYYFLRQE